MFRMGCALAKRMLVRDEHSQQQQQQQQLGDATQQEPSSYNLNSNDKQQQQQQQKVPTIKTTQRTTSIDDFTKIVDDPRMPLDKRQIFKITKSWKAIARAMSKTGTIMFVKLFEQNHDLLDLFTRFQHLKGASRLEDSMELQEHAATVMSTLDQSISTLSNYESLVTYLHSIGQLHKKVPSFKSQYFWEIEKPFLNAVKITLDERFNENIEQVYILTIKFIIETIIEGFGQDSGNKVATSSGDNNNDNNNNNDGNKNDGNNEDGGNNKKSLEPRENVDYKSKNRSPPSKSSDGGHKKSTTNFTTITGDNNSKQMLLKNQDINLYQNLDLDCEEDQDKENQQTQKSTNENKKLTKKIDYHNNKIKKKLQAPVMLKKTPLVSGCPFAQQTTKKVGDIS